MSADDTDPTADAILAARDRLEALRPAVEAGAPWPLAAVFDDTPEASWGPPEVLAHLGEMAAFWHGELARIATSDDPEPAPFGRLSSDADRLASIERDRHLPVDALFDQFHERTEAFLADWRAWSPDQRERAGLHPRLGEVAVRTGADRWFVAHIVDHAAQLEAVLGTAREG